MKINIGTNSTHISLKAHKGRSYLRLSPDSYDQKNSGHFTRKI